MQAKIRLKCATLGLVLPFALLTAGVSSATDSNPELWEFTGQVSRNVYRCLSCTFEQFLATPLPASNWEKNASAGNQRLFLADEGTNIPPAAPPGTLASLDLIPEIEGDDYTLIARVLGASFLGFGSQGPMANPRVARGTTLIYNAGTVIHKLARPDGLKFVLFSMSEIHTTTYDPFVVNGLAGMSVPTGWTYSSEVLLTELMVGTPTGVANLFAVPDYWSWQEVVVVPEPSTGVLLGIGLVGLAGRRRAG